MQPDNHATRQPMQPWNQATIQPYNQATKQPSNHATKQPYHNMRNQTDLVTESDERWLRSWSLDFGHILTSNYANYAKLRFFRDLDSFANASTHLILA